MCASLRQIRCIVSSIPQAQIYHPWKCEACLGAVWRICIDAATLHRAARLWQEPVVSLLQVLASQHQPCTVPGRWLWTERWVSVWVAAPRGTSLTEQLLCSSKIWELQTSHIKFSWSSLRLITNCFLSSFSWQKNPGSWSNPFLPLHPVLSWRYPAFANCLQGNKCFLWQRGRMHWQHNLLNCMIE